MTKRDLSPTGAPPQRGMPTISAFYGILIQMWFDDHPPPHFHAQYAEYNIVISIHTLTVVEGWLPRPQLRLVKEWGLAHRDELMDNWHRARHQPPKPLKRIAPLP